MSKGGWRAGLHVSGRALTVSAAVLWLPWAFELVAVLITYSWVAPEELYHVGGSGLGGGLSRALVLLNYPIALVALPVIGLSADRLRGNRAAVATAIGAALLCLVMVWPGVVDQDDLDGRPINIVPAVGVALAVVLGVRSGLFRDRVPVMRWAAAVIVAALLLSLPWLVAEWGRNLDGVPLLGWLFLTGTVVEGHAAVHLGHHHGMDGTLLFLAALPLIPLTRRVEVGWLRVAVGCYAGLQLAYGLANAIQDGYGEQIWKRGWVERQIPSLLHPEASVWWLGILALAAILAALILRQTRALAGPAGGAAAVRQPG